MSVTSADGVHWGAAARPVDLWPRGHQIMPAIGSTDGVLAVLFYDSREDPAYDPKRPPGNTAKGVSSGPSVSVMLARSTDGGATWSEARITPRPMSLDDETADAFRVPFVGDYLAVSAVDGTFALAWTDARDVRPGPDVREQGTALDDHDGFDTFAPCHWDPGSLSADRFTVPDPDDRCLTMGGLDQNIYATILPARSGGMPVA